MGRLGELQHLYATGKGMDRRLLRNPWLTGEIAHQSCGCRRQRLRASDNQRNRSLQMFGRKLWLRLLCSATNEIRSTKHNQKLFTDCAVISGTQNDKTVGERTTRQ